MLRFNMAKFVCENCGYRFDSEKEEFDKCPYCSKKGTVSKEQSVVDLVDQA